MGSEHTFYDYVDGAGSNTIHAWLNTIPKGAKVKINKRLDHLEAMKQWRGRTKARLVDTLTDRA